MRAVLSAGVAGLLFALGLGLGGMLSPAKVQAFLDVAGAWDPSLAFVMGGALTTHGLLRRLILRRKSPVYAPAFPKLGKPRVDGRLLLGAALFGVGWGLGGYCPGPALTALGSGTRSALIFGAALWAGMGLFTRWECARQAAAARQQAGQAPALDAPRR